VPATTAKPTLKERLAKLFAQYGTVAIYLYFGLSIATIIGFAVAFWSGIEPTDATGVLGVLGAAWLAGKATIFIRIPIVLAVTPPIAELLRRRKERRIAAGLELSDEQLAALDKEEDEAGQ
jgi:hypothetical protein